MKTATNERTLHKPPTIRNVDAALVRTFLSVVDLGTLQLAADTVFRTQAAVSQQVKRLEDLIEVRLFEKKGRRLQLTTAGEYFCPSAEYLRLCRPRFNGESGSSVVEFKRRRLGVASVVG